jgi:hypothetical protein
MKTIDNKHGAKLKRHGLRVPLAALLLCSVLSALCPLGCGYALHNKASLPFGAIKIGKIENKTLEPKLQDRLYRTLTEEFLKQGVDVNAAAGYKIDGTIHDFALKILSEKSEAAVDYEVTVKADFILTDPSGNTREFKNVESPFIVSFSAPGSINDLIAAKEIASERAMKEIAVEIVAGITYR